VAPAPPRMGTRPTQKTFLPQPGFPHPAHRPPGSLEIPRKSPPLGGLGLAPKPGPFFGVTKKTPRLCRAPGETNPPHPHQKNDRPRPPVLGRTPVCRGGSPPEQKLEKNLGESRNPGRGPFFFLNFCFPPLVCPKVTSPTPGPNLVNQDKNKFFPSRNPLQALFCPPPPFPTPIGKLKKAKNVCWPPAGQHNWVKILPGVGGTVGETGGPRLPRWCPVWGGCQMPTSWGLFFGAPPPPPPALFSPHGMKAGGSHPPL